MKLPLLCESCEQILSGFERLTANNVFHPLVRGEQAEVTYGDWFLRFCVSISWRALQLVRLQANLNHFTAEQRQESEKALETWRTYLLGETKNPGRFEQRLMFVTPITSAPEGCVLQPNANRYLTRNMDIDAVSSTSKTAFAFSKIGPFILFGMIETEERWNGTKVNANSGVVGPSTYQIPPAIFNYLMSRAKVHSKAYREIPTAQQERLYEQVRENPERFLNSGLFQAMAHDVALFGEAAFWDGKKE